MSMAANMALLDSYDQTIDELELFLEHRVKAHDASSYYLLRSVPRIGKIIWLTILYEISRFPLVGQFLSYARLVAGQRELLWHMITAYDYSPSPAFTHHRRRSSKCKSRSAL